jgi:FkbM family methyltransferase
MKDLIVSDFIFFADRIVSVAKPYIEDNFVKSHCIFLEEGEVGNLVRRYQEISINNPVFKKILNYLYEVSSSETLSIVDIGVFMGEFTNGISLAARQLGYPLSIDSYEANPNLLSSIISNFKIYDTKARLHWAAVSNQSGTIELVVPEGGAVGGSVSPSASRKYGNYFSVEVDALSLSDILKDESTPCIVKIDIEGHEVPAFSSISESVNKLNNIFIVEYSPSQASELVGGMMKYSEFLLKYFDIYNLGNWGWVNKFIRISEESSLLDIDLGNGSFNTDILLVPKNLNLKFD